MNWRALQSRHLPDQTKIQYKHVNSTSIKYTNIEIYIYLYIYTEVYATFRQSCLFVSETQSIKI